MSPERTLLQRGDPHSRLWRAENYVPAWRRDIFMVLSRGILHSPDWWNISVHIKYLGSQATILSLQLGFVGISCTSSHFFFSSLSLHYQNLTRNIRDHEYITLKVFVRNYRQALNEKGTTNIWNLSRRAILESKAFVLCVTLFGFLENSALMSTSFMIHWGSPWLIFMRRVTGEGLAAAFETYHKILFSVWMTTLDRKSVV